MLKYSYLVFEKKQKQKKKKMRKDGNIENEYYRVLMS